MSWQFWKKKQNEPSDKIIVKAKIGFDWNNDGKQQKMLEPRDQV